MAAVGDLDTRGCDLLEKRSNDNVSGRKKPVLKRHRLRNNKKTRSLHENRSTINNHTRQQRRKTRQIPSRIESDASFDQFHRVVETSSNRFSWKLKIKISSDAGDFESGFRRRLDFVDITVFQWILKLGS
jgi:hypothetical protein